MAAKIFKCSKFGKGGFIYKKKNRKEKITPSRAFGRTKNFENFNFHYIVRTRSP